jgi:hypothetical protein
MLSTVAALSLPPKSKKSVDERRSVYEKARTTRVARIKTDFSRIVKREVEFSKKLVNELIPFQVVWNETAINKVKDSMPFTFVEKDDDIDDVLTDF